ncbi:MAG: hypothetical protein QM571_02920 [Micrococcaceae bacterium]
MPGPEKMDALEFVVAHHDVLEQLERSETISRPVVIQLLGLFAEHRRVFDISALTIEDWYRSLNLLEVTSVEAKEVYDLLDSFTGYFSKAFFLQMVKTNRREKEMRQRYVQLGSDKKYQEFREKYHGSAGFRSFLERAAVDQEFCTEIYVSWDKGHYETPQEAMKRKYQVLIPSPQGGY